MNIDDLKIFIALNEFKSIAKTSSELFISHSTISYRLSELEKEMGQKLIIRGKGQLQLTLTEAGKRFLLIAERICNLHMEALHISDEEIAQQLVISGVDSVNSYFMIDFYRTFIQKNPHISLSILNGYSADIPKRVSQGVYDLGISNEHGNIDSIVADVLFKEDYVCLKRRSSDKHNDSIEKIDTDSLNPKNEFYQKFDADFTQWHISRFSDVRPRFNSEIAKLNAHIMQTDYDWSIMPYTVAKYYESKGCYTIYKLDSPPPPRIVYIITNNAKNQYNSETVERFKAELKKYSEDYFRECKEI